MLFPSLCQLHQSEGSPPPGRRSTVFKKIRLC
jgi:hypothetical protein